MCPATARPWVRRARRVLGGTSSGGAASGSDEAATIRRGFRDGRFVTWRGCGLRLPSRCRRAVRQTGRRTRSTRSTECPRRQTTSCIDGRRETPGERRGSARRSEHQRVRVGVTCFDRPASVFYFPLILPGRVRTNRAVLPSLCLVSISPCLLQCSSKHTCTHTLSLTQTSQLSSGLLLSCGFDVSPLPLT